MVPMSERNSRDERAYYLNLQGRITGPFSFRRMREGILSGTIEAWWHVQRAGNENWVAIVDLPEFHDSWDRPPERQSQTSRETPLSKRGQSGLRPGIASASARNGSHSPPARVTPTE